MNSMHPHPMLRRVMALLAGAALCAPLCAQEKTAPAPQKEPPAKPQVKKNSKPKPAALLSRDAILKQMATSDDEAFHAMLFWLPETRTLFSNVIDTKNPVWVGFEYSRFKELSPERKSTLLKEITKQVTSLSDAEWQKQQRRMNLWVVLFQQQRALMRVYSQEPYLNAAYSVEKLRPVFAKSIATRKQASSNFNPATIGDSVSSAEGHKLGDAVISRLLLLKETERIQALVQICLHMAEHAQVKVGAN